MPLGCGFVGVIPAMNYLLTPNEWGPLSLRLDQLVVWSLGLCYFGVVFAVPLRHQVIVRERLRFPSGFSTAVLITVLHGHWRPSADKEALDAAARGGYASLVPRNDSPNPPSAEVRSAEPSASGQEPEPEPEPEPELESESESEPDAQSFDPSDWAYNMRLLMVSFCMSGAFTICTYFFPVLRNIPILGTGAASSWLWTLNPSLAYVGQGIIMGVETTMHMTFGAIIGWGILSPLAKFRGWAPGPVDDWQHGSKGWIVWISLAIMLVDAVISLCFVALRSVVGIRFTSLLGCTMLRLRGSWNSFGRRAAYHPLPSDEQQRQDPAHIVQSTCGQDEQLKDAPADQRIDVRLVVAGLLASIFLCIGTVHAVFGNLVPIYATIVAVLMALVLSIMGVRALGETDLNPVSGISKLAQLFFAIIVPQTSKSSVLINLVAGAISEAGALQAGDLMQDLKTGHLLGASPKAQFWGQMIGATVGAILSALLYRLYTKVYTIPGELFQVPTAYVWIFTARLVTGQGLPPMASQWATGAGAFFTLTTMARIASVGRAWRSWVPGGIAVAVGMYNVPSFTLGRAAGGLIGWFWTRIMQRSGTPLIIIASGFILGEGCFSPLHFRKSQD
ncbi:hypothetical protein XA68_18400 [Ophiocordyceps unilateralis]|uniref:Oligopeptide transporter n=1 Tax=Ophiocordyceps unilateralis TaxID=268505 RepID=A0A2A9P3G3_OPHUN|nr:hypothetical protein XA68_18400 [Ophiocordyceps unilateralis]